MNTQQLFEVLKHDPFTSKYNYNVLPLNHFLENSFSRLSMLIINYDTCDNPGSHWVAVFIDKDRNIEYFDSYGILPMYSSIMNKLTSISANKSPTFNLTCFQGNSTACGQYCLLYLLLKARGFTLKRIQNIFHMTKVAKERDFVVNYFVNFNYDKLFD